MDHHDNLARIYNVSTDSCNTFVFVPKCASPSLSCLALSDDSHRPPLQRKHRGGKLAEDFDLLRAESKLQLNNWFYEHVRAKVAVTNDLPFDVEVRWETTDSPSVPKALIDIPRGKTADIDTFESHHLRFYKRDVRVCICIYACMVASLVLPACLPGGGLRPARSALIHAAHASTPPIHPPTHPTTT